MIKYSQGFKALFVHIYGRIKEIFPNKDAESTCRDTTTTIHSFPLPVNPPQETLKVNTLTKQGFLFLKGRMGSYIFKGQEVLSITHFFQLEQAKKKKKKKKNFL